MESNDSPEIPDRGETSDIPGLPSGALFCNLTTLYADVNSIAKPITAHFAVIEPHSFNLSEHLLKVYQNAVLLIMYAIS